MNDVAKERIDTAVRNILSGDNACGTLANAVQKRDASYFWRAVAPLAQAYEEEAAAIAAQRQAALDEAGKCRYALEIIIANGGNLRLPEVNAAVCKALGRCV